MTALLGMRSAHLVSKSTASLTCLGYFTARTPHAASTTHVDKAKLVGSWRLRLQTSMAGPPAEQACLEQGANQASLTVVNHLRPAAAPALFGQSCARLMLALMTPWLGSGLASRIHWPGWRRSS